jgi:putative intracellular protease/amidase
MDPPMSYDNIGESEETFVRGHQPTGVDVFELGYIWMTLRKQLQMDLVFATPRGGPVAADPLSMERIQKDSKLREHLRDERDFIMKMGHTLPISWIKPEEFKMVILPGGHGAMFDLPEHDDVACAVAEIWRKNGFVAAIGHGVAGLLNVRMERRGEYLMKGKRMTCFSKEEERQVGYEKFLPYSLEDRVKERGAKLDIKKPFDANVVVDDRLITAQNAPSIHEFVSKITDKLRR